MAPSRDSSERETFIEGFQEELVPQKVPRSIPLVIQRVVPRTLEKFTSAEGFEEAPVRRRRSIGPTVQGWINMKLSCRRELVLQYWRGHRSGIVFKYF